MRRLALATFVVLAACSRGEPEAIAPARVETARPRTPEEQARAIAGDPRLLLFDVQTALEAVRETSGGYPTSSEFGLEERWSLQRAALDAGFSSWEYRSDGTTYRLTGESGGKRFEIASPS